MSDEEVEEDQNRKVLKKRKELEREEKTAYINVRISMYMICFSLVFGQNFKEMQWRRPDLLVDVGGPIGSPFG